MPTTPLDAPPSTLRRRLAAQRPGRPTAIACAIATALAAVGLDGPRPDNATAAGDRPGAPQLATESPSAMALAQRDPGLHDRFAPSGGRRAAPSPGRDQPTNARPLRRAIAIQDPVTAALNRPDPKLIEGSWTTAIDAAKAQLGAESTWRGALSGPFSRSVRARRLELHNDLGLLSEQYDIEIGRLVGEFPQRVFGHLPWIETASILRPRAVPGASESQLAAAA
jgi:hypothetical protein